jgi:diguanylate cyclase (GGDEF)-like protein
MNKKVFKILLVDDDEDDYILTRDLLSEIGRIKYDLEWASTYDAGLQKISLNNHDVCIFDYQLGKRTGLELLREAVSVGCKTPIILLTGQGTHEIDMEAMNAGAADYLNKREITAQLLERSVRYAIKHKRAEERILQMAYYDNLTKLPNRALFQDRFKQTLAHAERYKKEAALLFMDLDNFKRINDTFEHRFGDLLLKGVAERLTNYVRMADTVARRELTPCSVARLGGDEFTVLLTEIHSMQDAASVAHRILDILSQPFHIDGHEIFVTASIGIALYPLDGKDIDPLLKNADTAMYHAKNQGKNNFQFYKRAMNACAFENLTMENCLRRAMEREEFLLHYQPRMDLRTGKIVGAEALIRWNHPAKGLIYPAEFIPIAEETGIILPLGEWVLKNASEQIKDWQRSGIAKTRIIVSANLSGRQFRQENLLEVVSKVIDSSGIDPQYLELEITENIIMESIEKTSTTLKKLKKMGIHISIDDFGTGYSSFSYLRYFPLDIIKIDRSFIKDITKNDEVLTIVKAIIAMAHTLKLRVVAEGVETNEQMRLLIEQGCDEMQGYLLSAPLSAEEVLKFLSEKEIKFALVK